MTRRFLPAAAAVPALLLLSALQLLVPAGAPAEHSVVGPPRARVTREWRYATGGALRTPIAVGTDGSSYFAAEDRYLYALDLDGGLRWRYDTRRMPDGVLSLAGDGVVLISVAPNRLVGVNQSGERAFSRRLSDRILAPAITRDGNIVLTFGEGGVVFLTPAGRVLWERRLDTKIPAAPVIGADGSIYIATAGPRVIRLNQDGRSIGATKLSEPPRRLFALRDGAVLAWSGEGVMRRYDQRLETVWQRELGAPRDVVVSERCGLLAAVAEDGSVTRVGLADGEPADGEPAGSESRGGARMSDPVGIAVTTACSILVASSSGVIAFAASESEPSRVLESEMLGGRGAELIQLDASDRILVATEDWVVQSFGFEEGAIATASDAESASLGGWRGARGNDALTGFWAAPGPRTGFETARGESLPLDLLYVEELFFEGGTADRREALSELREIIEEPRLSGRRQEVRTLLRRMIESGSGAGAATSSELRVDAVELLSMVGDLPSAALLARLSVDERDESVRRAYLNAFARVRSDRSRGMLQSTIRYLRTGRRSESVELAALEALVGLVSHNGSDSHRAALDELARLSERGVTREVRSRARFHLMFGRFD